MIGHYTRASLRNLTRTKAHTLINLAGLTLGFLCAVILFQKIRYELSYDTHVPDAERIYRVVTEDRQFGQEDYGRGLPYPFFDAFRLDFPEDGTLTLVDRNFPDPLITAHRPDGQGDTQPALFRETDGNVAVVDTTFFDLFPRHWLHGAPETALTTPRSAVISERLATKYFGTSDVVGQRLTFDNMVDLTIMGVVSDPVEPATLALDLVISPNLGEDVDRTSDAWSSVSSSVQGYVKLAPGVTAAQVEQRLRPFITKHREAEVAEYLTYQLQPLPEIHFDTRFGGDNLISRDALWALALIALVLLVTAGINFINLNTVLVFRRAKEVGVRKVLGGSPGHIAAYFLTETTLLTAAALGLALLLAPVVLRLAQPFVGGGFSVDVLADPVLALTALGAAALVTVGAGFYPAFLLARLRPTHALRGPGSQRPGAFLSLRRSLVTVQFAISQVLIICTLAAVFQMRYLNERPLGYDSEALVEFAIPERDSSRLLTFKQELLRSSAVEAVTLSNSGASSSRTWVSNFHYERPGGEPFENNAQTKLGDRDYVDTYGMEVIAGEAFHPGRRDTTFLVNEAFVALLGLESPEDLLGEEIRMWNWSGPVQGVVRDFNTRSLHEVIEPTVIAPTLAFAYTGAARVQTAQLDRALADIEAAWLAAFPDQLYEYQFLDDTIAEFYERDRATQQLIQAFALVAILIGCVGLFGLIAYTTAQRKKEVGIRKVLGASAAQIVALLTREFVVMVLLGFAVAAPLAYVVMQQWLDNFAYRIDLGAGVFGIGLLMSLVIALGTVGLRSYRAAQTNPVDAIQYE